MKLLRFRIKHYKSITDSGECYFSDKLTILAGKNESGKTSILEALADFHEDKTISDDAKPINGKGVPEVSVTFKLSSGEYKNICSEASVELVEPKVLEITLVKKYGSNDYVLSDDSLKNMALAEPKKSLGVVIEEYVAKNKLVIDIPKYTTQETTTYKTELEALLAQPSNDTITNDHLKAIISLVEGYTLDVDKSASFVTAFVAKHLPHFILFSSFDDVFPDTITIADLDASEWTTDLEEVSNFDRKLISSTDSQTRRNHQQNVNAEFDDKFKKYWTQDEIKLEVEKDGESIYFWIVENGGQYKPSQRSKGQQWYLSFYIKIVARMSEDKPNVLLIDEPGLYLHARAQKDLLNILDSHTSDYPVIFSTHSPYLITEDNLENIRLVEKPIKGGTTILGKVHAHEKANKETLTPILTAIGLGINDSITNLDQKDNIIVEGPEDVFYLQAFKLVIDKQKAPQSNFINGGGAPNMGIVGSILEGWGCNVLYLYDNDQGKLDGEKQLKKIWKVLPECIKAVTTESGTTIADILSANDFKTFVLTDQSLQFKIKNSEYIKSKKLDKVLLARKFLQQAKNGDVSIDEATTKSIIALFAEIEFK